MGFFGMFLSLGKLLGRAFRIIQQVVPEEHLQVGIALVKEAARRFVDNAERREWVIAQLMSRFRVPESVARLIVEISVQAVKKELSP